MKTKLIFELDSDADAYDKIEFEKVANYHKAYMALAAVDSHMYTFRKYLKHWDDEEIPEKLERRIEILFEDIQEELNWTEGFEI
jgi:hypothetical protein